MKIEISDLLFRSRFFLTLNRKKCKTVKSKIRIWKRYIVIILYYYI